LARAIAARHLKERVESREQRRELLRIEVSAIVKDMLERSEQLAQARVRKMLSEDSLKARRMLGQCFNEVISELSLAESHATLRCVGAQIDGQGLAAPVILQYGEGSSGIHLDNTVGRLLTRLSNVSYSCI